MAENDPAPTQVKKVTPSALIQLDISKNLAGLAAVVALLGAAAHEAAGQLLLDIDRRAL